MKSFGGPCINSSLPCLFCPINSFLKIKKAVWGIKDRANCPLILEAQKQTASQTCSETLQATKIIQKM